jgi:hypothetical protein
VTGFAKAFLLIKEHVPGKEKLVAKLARFIPLVSLSRRQAGDVVTHRFVSSRGATIPDAH